MATQAVGGKGLVATDKISAIDKNWEKRRVAGSQGAAGLDTLPPPGARVGCPLH